MTNPQKFGYSIPITLQRREEIVFSLGDFIGYETTPCIRVTQVEIQSLPNDEAKELGIITVPMAHAIFAICTLLNIVIENKNCAEIKHLNEQRRDWFYKLSNEFQAIYGDD